MAFFNYISGQVFHFLCSYLWFDSSAILGVGIEYAVAKAIGSAFSYKGTVFLSYETDNSPLEVQGEYSISCKDVSIALGRIFTVLASVRNANSVRMFLARLIYLDAVGCVDFTTMKSTGIQILVDALSEMWTAIERKDDFFMVGNLKYPLKTNALRVKGQKTRRKHAMSNFIHSVNTKGSVYSGIYLIGMASETMYSDIRVFNQFSNSVFNVVAVDTNRPTEELGVLLTTLGFTCGILLQELFEHLILYIKSECLTKLKSLEFLTSTLYIRKFLKRAHEFYSTEKYFYISSNKGQALKGILLLRFEIQIFINAFWDTVLNCIGPNVIDADVTTLREAIISMIQEKLNSLLADEDKFKIDNVIATAKKAISDIAEQEIHRAARALNYTADELFLSNCYLLWQQLCSKTNCLGILYGCCASGKTAIVRTVLIAMRSFKGIEFLTPSVVSSNSSALAGWKAALMLTRVIRRWKHRKRLFLGDNCFQDPLKRTIEPAESANSEPAARPKSANNERSNTNEPNSAHIQGHTVTSTIIHHASLTSDHLIGKFDIKGRWSDGLLLRLLRNHDANIVRNHNNSTHSSVFVIILDGPLGSQLEQLFSASRYNVSKGLPSNYDVDNNLLVFPSGESCMLSQEVSVLIETSDLSQSSPAMLLYTAKIDVKTDSSHSFSRLVTSWLKRFIPSLMKFGPWVESANELQEVLSKDDLISGLLYFDSTEGDISCSASISKTGCFFRYLEELLLQCHELFLNECVKVLSEEKATVGKLEKTNQPSRLSKQGSRVGNVSFMIDDDPTSMEKNDSGSADSDMQFIMDPRGQERMLQRCRCAIMYAAIWGFGGSFNGSDRRRFFETVAHRIFTEIFGPYAEFPPIGSLFDLVIDLKEGVFTNALESRRVLYPVHKSLEQFVTYSSFSENDNSTTAQSRLRAGRLSASVNPNEQHHILAPVDVEETIIEKNSAVSASLQNNDFSSNLIDESKKNPAILNFYTPASWALKSTVDIIFKSGGCVLLSGLSCTGKSTIMNNLLRTYGSNCPHPRNMKSDILNCLLDMISGEGVPEGTPAVLDILTSFLNRIGGASVIKNSSGDNNTSAVSVWNAVRKVLQENDGYKVSTRDHCASKTVFSSSVSLRIVPTADALRNWLIRELGTENSLVLEAPRFTRAVVFFDDLHMTANHSMGSDESEQSEPNRVVENRLEGLLRGLLQHHSSLIEPSAFVNADYHGDKKDSECTLIKMKGILAQGHDINKGPILHRALLTDPRIDISSENDYFVDDIGIVAAATGDHKHIERHQELKQLLQHFCVLSTPLVSVKEIHSALVQGSTLVLHTCPLVTQNGGEQILINCLRELSDSSVSIMRMLMESSGAEIGVSSLEGSQRKLLFLSLPMIQRLCSTLSISKQLISSPVSLLQLWVHEWKRNYLDVFPHGIQRSRLVEIIQGQIDKVDIRKWNISSVLHQSIVSDVEIVTGSVWIDVENLLKRTSIVGNRGLKHEHISLQAISEIDSSEDESDRDAPVSELFTRYTPVGMLASSGSSEPHGESISRKSPVESKQLNLKLSTNSSLLSVLYPAAVALMLRLVRILTSISSHVVISGFVGASQLPVIHLAANVCNMGLDTFEVARCYKATKFNISSERSEVAVDFKSFLRHCAMRVCGVKLQQRVGTSHGPSVFLASENDSVLIAVTSAQLLTMAERQILLNMIDGDFAALFSDEEIEGTI